MTTREELVGRRSVVGLVFFALELSVRAAFVHDVVLHHSTTAVAIHAVADRVTTRVVRDEVVLFRVPAGLAAESRC